MCGQNRVITFGISAKKIHLKINYLAAVENAKPVKPSLWQRLVSICKKTPEVDKEEVAHLRRQYLSVMDTLYRKTVEASVGFLLQLGKRFEDKISEICTD